MSRRHTLAALPVLFLLALSAVACSDSLAPNQPQINARHGADDPAGDDRGVDAPGDDKGVDSQPRFKRGADDLAGDDRGGHGADDSLPHQ